MASKPKPVWIAFHPLGPITARTAAELLDKLWRQRGLGGMTARGLRWAIRRFGESRGLGVRIILAR